MREVVSTVQWRPTILIVSIEKQIISDGMDAIAPPQAADNREDAAQFLILTGNALRL